MKLTRHIDLPRHEAGGGFDHASIHSHSRRLFVAHTANDALDVIDCAAEQYTYSIPDLPGVAGALVSNEHDLLFTSNRGDNTVGIFSLAEPGRPSRLATVPVGVRPNGLAYDPGRRLLAAANVGDPGISGSCTVSVVDVASGSLLSEIPVPGRTRWVVYDPTTDRFCVNISDPATIAMIDPSRPHAASGWIAVPASGPHGLDLDGNTGRLYCACDGGEVVTLDIRTGTVLGRLAISGVPDVVFLHSGLKRLYVAVGDPGVIDVIDTRAMRAIESVATERRAHTTALDVESCRLFVFLPLTHRAAVFTDS